MFQKINLKIKSFLKVNLFKLNFNFETYNKIQSYWNKLSNFKIIFKKTNL